MNDEQRQLLEREIRNLRPAPLPSDLQKRMAAEPSLPKNLPPRRIIPWVVATGLAAAACLAIVAQLPTPVTPAPPAAASPTPQEHLSIIKHESTLMDARTLAFREHKGRMWELVERVWQEETIALCSTTPIRVRSTEIRPESVWLPVEFQ